MKQRLEAVEKTIMIVFLPILAVTLPTVLQSQALYDGEGPARTDVGQPRQFTLLQPDQGAVTPPETCPLHELPRPWDERRQASFCPS